MSFWPLAKISINGIEETDSLSTSRKIKQLLQNPRSLSGGAQLRSQSLRNPGIHCWGQGTWQL